MSNFQVIQTFHLQYQDKKGNTKGTPLKKQILLLIINKNYKNCTHTIFLHQRNHVTL